MFARVWGACYNECMWKKKPSGYYSENQALKEAIREYHKYLEDELGYEIPRVSSMPMANEMETWEKMGQFSEYDRRYKSIGLSAATEIAGHVYDMRESKYNKLAIENSEMKKELLRLKLAVLLFTEMLSDYQKKSEKNLENSYKLWEKIAKKIGINDDIISFHELCDGLKYIGGDPVDINERIEEAEKRGKPLDKNHIKRLKEHAAEKEAQNELLKDFEAYLKHEDCRDLRCDIEESDKECLRLRRRFDRDYFEKEMYDMGYSEEDIAKDDFIDSVVGDF